MPARLNLSIDSPRDSKFDLVKSFARRNDSHSVPVGAAAIGNSQLAQAPGELAFLPATKAPDHTRITYVECRNAETWQCNRGAVLFTPPGGFPIPLFSSVSGSSSSRPSSSVAPSLFSEILYSFGAFSESSLGGFFYWKQSDLVSRRQMEWGEASETCLMSASVFSHGPGGRRGLWK